MDTGGSSNAALSCLGAILAEAARIRSDSSLLLGPASTRGAPPDPTRHIPDVSRDPSNRVAPEENPLPPGSSQPPPPIPPSSSPQPMEGVVDGEETEGMSEHARRISRKDLTRQRIRLETRSRQANLKSKVTTSTSRRPSRVPAADGAGLSNRSTQ